MERTIGQLPLVVGTLLALGFGGCDQGTLPEHPGSTNDSASTGTPPMDQHTHARPDEAVARHLDLDIAVDMAAKRIEGTASYDIEAKGDRIVFDTDGLDIQRVELGDGTPARFSLGDSTLLGRPLTIEIPRGTRRVRIAYRTGSSARALQWLSPQQTADKKKPFLFTQGEAILTRTWIPVQDSPGIRITYSAKVTVPSDLMAVMSATNPQERSQDGVYRFTMDKPVPSYLIALAVGDIAFKPIGTRTGVYAEKSLVDTAAWEFADMERMVEAAESLYGPYRWGRYDVIVLPPSFPFGGMENPMLTFATPTIIAGDRSLTSLIAHELAHSWSGNLVTNATWNDFWLNEGFTVYFEHRISEKLYGKDYSDMTAVLGHQDLLGTLKDVAEGTHPEDSKLKLDLAGRDPDDGMTDIAYEKGYALLRLLESKVGRERFDAFLRGYFDRFAFQSMTTEGFVAYLKEQLLDPNKVALDLDRWIYQAGLPEDDIVPGSDKFTQVEGEIARWQKGTPAKQLATAGWTTFEWIHFVRHLPDGLDRSRMSELDSAFGFTGSGNSEILTAWLEQCIKNDHAPAYEKLDAFLTTVGRRKFLTPLYEALIKTEKGRAMAQNIYKAARPNYHAVAVRTIDELLDWKEMAGPISL